MFLTFPPLISAIQSQQQNNRLQLPFTAPQRVGKSGGKRLKGLDFFFNDSSHFPSQPSTAAFVFESSLSLNSAFYNPKTGYGAAHAHYGAMQRHQPSGHQQLHQPYAQQQHAYGQQQHAYGNQQAYGGNRGGIQGGGGPGGNSIYSAPGGPPPGGFAPQRPMGQYQGGSQHHAPQYGGNSGWMR